MSLLTLADLAKSYARVAALKHASLELEPGEVHGLMGENGAGKSTLIKILAGVVAADGGVITLDERPVSITNPHSAHAHGLRFIHQELNVVPQLSVAENILLGRRTPLRLGFLVNWKKAARIAAQTLATLQINHIDPRRKMATLSMGDRMLVKIASAFLQEEGAPPRIFIMDEPTAALSDTECARLFDVIKTMRGRGCGILYVSHRMDEVMQMCDRVTIMRDGETLMTKPVAQTSQAAIIEAMTGRALVAAFPPRQSEISAGTGLSVENLFGNLSFTVRKGEILGLAGLANAGQSETLRALLAVDGAHDGIALNGLRSTATDPAGAWRNRFAYVPGERRSEGLILSQSVTHNTTLPHLRELARARWFVNHDKETALAQSLASQVRLKSASLDQAVWKLSGGNQQKIMLARAMAGNPALLLLDEPTRGVDVGAKFDIHLLLRALSARGLAIIMASSDLAELIAMTDRILVLRRGQPATTVSTQGLTQAALLALCFGKKKAA